MPYNGVGLSSARGSGTSGYVTKNLGSLGDKLAYKDSQANRKRATNKGQIGVNETKKQMIRDQLQAELISHEEMRQIENKCIDFQDKLEEHDEAQDPEIIKQKVNELKSKLISQLKDSKAQDVEANRIPIAKEQSLEEAISDRRVEEATSNHEIEAATCVDRSKGPHRIRSGDNSSKFTSNSGTATSLNTEKVYHYKPLYSNEKRGRKRSER